ncbi:MAG: bifunctional DNA-formamidopyrimidine glycosylase/DNA-(apurinic or apyrimidinic site) lyase [Planctomycetota bacterium]|jgi:formamidopyrimidine-DNA glycosylase|nr:bifunctional DNA-formamidopyrimidine glycosylase/DNA-(apurinic or apyrimidinic site) lyase [Planctomycetota bacterium]
MPELPEVETITRALRRAVVGRILTRFYGYAEKLRQPLDAATINRSAKNRSIVAVARRAKFIVLTLDNGAAVVIHLGMTGSLRIDKKAEPRRAHDHAVFALDNGEKLVYNDPRKFGLIKFCATDAELKALLGKLAVEPLSAPFTPAYLAAKNARAATPIKTQIMKQEIVVGVGNIYASEALHRAGIAPERPAKSLSAAETAAVVAAIKEVLKESIKHGGTTISDYRQLSGREGNFTRRLRVYDRAGLDCRHCGGKIRKITQAGRSTYFCEKCQI